MKQKDADFAEGHAIVLYVEKDDGGYGPVQTGSYVVTHHEAFMLERRAELRAQAWAKWKAGETSPIAYWREVFGMAPADLAERAGVFGWTLRKHETPKGYAALKAEQRVAYADVFGMEPEELDRIPTPDGAEP